MELRGGDEVVGMTVVDLSRTLLTITRKGYGKRTSFDDFRAMKNRGGIGVTCQKTSEKTGTLSSVITVGENDDIMLMTKEGTIIRVPAASIPVYSRTAGGVIVMRPAEGDEILSFVRVEKEEEITAEIAEAEAAPLPPETEETEETEEPDGAEETDAAADTEETDDSDQTDDAGSDGE